MFKSESRAVILRLLLQALFLHTSTNTITVTNLLSNFRNVSFSVDGVDYQSLPPQISSDSTTNMFDNNPETHFEVAAGRISHSMTINIFLPSAMIQKISIQTGSLSYTVSLQNDERTWLHRVGTECRESYLRLVNNVYYQCLSYGSNVIVDLEDFYVADNNNVTWWTVFNKLAITFNITINSTASIVIKDISALGRFPAVGNVCNCFLPGVINANSPCDQQGRCLCRDDVGSRDCSTCKSSNPPYIYPTYGPVGGGQHVSLFQGSCWNFSAASKVYIGEESCDLAPKCTTKAQICTRFRNIYPNGTYINDASNKCCTGSYNESSVGLNLPVKVCWESFCVALDNIAYLLKANPVFNVMKRKSIIISGGIKVVFEGKNLNFAPNPTLLTQAFSGSSYTFESSVNSTDITKRVCTVNSEETLMTCYTVNLNDRSISRDYATYTFAFSIYSKFSCDENIYLINEPGFIKFTVCPDPNISNLYPYVRELPRDTDNPTVMINGNGLTGCTKDEFGLELADYQVMVQNVNSEVVDLKSNSILFRPPSTKPAGCYLNENEACEIKVLVGSLKLVVGFIQYDRNWTPIILAAVLGSVGGILLIVLVVSIVYCAKRKKLCFKEKVIPKEVHEVHARSLLDDVDEPLRLKVQRCLVDAAQVIKQQEIGKGFFGKVYFGQYNEKPVAIKTIHGEARFNMMKKINFLEEAVMMVDFSHPNVLTLLAITIEDNIPNVILPFMENGDLRSYVLDEKNKFVLGELLNFCLQVASGMEYLAVKKFVHRDLAARNCMVDSSLTVKVADFGLARDLYETNYYIAENRSIPLPYKWMPIECLSGKLQFSEKTDVWSYGVLMWEVFTRGGSPYFGLQHRELKHFLKRGERLEKPEIVPDYLYAVMCSCWHSESRSRPTFSELKSSIESIFTFDQDYLTHQKEAKEESQLVRISEHELNNVYELNSGSNINFQ